MKTATTDRRQEVLEAAMVEFMEKGLAGARLQAIADRVGVTKAMIHYYFDTKEKLFEEVFRRACADLFEGLMPLLESEVPLFVKIDQFVSQMLDRLYASPARAEFVVTELNRYPELTADIFWDEAQFEQSTFDGQLKDAASNYEIAPVDSRQVLANIISLCLFPYSGSTMIKGLLQINDQGQYAEFLQQRRGIISDAIINWLAS